MPIEDEREDFEQVRFARTKEAGNPHAICGQLMKVTVCEGVQSQRDIAGDNILLLLGLEVTGIISLDDTVNGAVNRFKKQLVNFHASQRR